MFLSSPLQLPFTRHRPPASQVAVYPPLAPSMHAILQLLPTVALLQLLFQPSAVALSWGGGRPEHRRGAAAGGKTSNAAQQQPQKESLRHGLTTG